MSSHGSKTLMSHFKLVLVKLYILLTPSCFVFLSYWNAGGHFASWIQRHRQLWPMELRGLGWGWRGSGEAPGQNYKAPPLLRLSLQALLSSHTHTHQSAFCSHSNSLADAASPTNAAPQGTSCIGYVHWEQMARERVNCPWMHELQLLALSNEV